jgi:hypothetical protein
MALDASVFNALAMPRKSAIDYRDQYGAADQQYASNALAIQKAQADAADAALARGDQMAYRNALAALPADATPDQAISAAQNTRTPLGMTQAQTMRKAQLDATKTQADIGHLGAQTRAQDSTATLNAAKTDKEKHDLQQSKLTQHLQGLFAVNDPQAAAAWLDKASQLDDADYSPEQVAGVKQMLAQNPAAFSQWKLGAMNRGMTIVQQREQAMKDAELARQKDADRVKAANEKIVLDPVTGKPSVNTPLVNANAQIAAAGAAQIPGMTYMSDKDGNIIGLPTKAPVGRTVVANVVTDANRMPVPGKDAGLNEGQSKALLFGTRMQEADRILNELSAAGVDRPSMAKQVADSVPLVGGALGSIANSAQSPNQQRVEQAQRDFVNAVLRKESGASISPTEFDSARKQYFPAIGDSDEVKAQKARNRATAIQGMLIEVPKSQRGSITPGAPTASRIGSVDVPPDIAAILKKHGGK